MQSILVTPLICTFAALIVPAWGKKRHDEYQSHLAYSVLCCRPTFLILLWCCSVSLVDTEIAGINKTTVLSETEMIKIQSGN